MLRVKNVQNFKSGIKIAKLMLTILLKINDEKGK